jgi:hypothetical protein
MAGNFLTSWQLSASQEELCSMKLACSAVFLQLLHKHIKLFYVILKDMRFIQCFVCFCSFLTNLTSNLSVKRSTVSRLLSTQDVTAFWTRFREIFSPQEEKLWDGLLIGLQMYHRILEGMS